MIVMPNGLKPKQTEPLTELEMNWLAIGEDVCRKLHLVIACPRCLMAGNKTGAILRGNNSPSDPVLSVTCDCRHMVFRHTAD